MHQPGSHMRKVTHDFTVLLRCMTFVFLAIRIQPFPSLVDREVEFLCTNNLIVIHFLGIIYLFIFYFHFISIYGVTNVCMDSCVFFSFILNIKFVGRTSRGHTAGRSQDFSSTFLLRCVP